MKPWMKATVAAAMVLGACTSGKPGAGTTRTSDAATSVPASPADGTSSPTTAAVVSSPSPTTHLNLVAIGDSTAQSSSCDGCTDFVDLYARAITKNYGIPVEVDNRAFVQYGNVPPAQVTQILADVETDASLRTALANADIVVVDVGYNDTAWNRFDDPCNAAPNYPRVRWQELSTGCIRSVTAQYKQTLDEILTEIAELRGCSEFPGQPPCSERGGKDTLVLVVTAYNPAIGDTIDPGWGTPEAARKTALGTDLMVNDQCEVARFHGGRCADLYHAMNGPKGTNPAGRYLVTTPDGYPHLNQRGHQLVADDLIAIGLAPLHP
jgi:GDSL-like lipase/acylhydrolase family protein